jgi:serine protease
MNHRTAVRVFSSTLLAALTFGCSSDNIPAVGPSSGILQVTPLFAGFLPGATKQLAATFNGTAVPVTWATTNPAIATVSADGLVTGVASGTASITASMSSDPTQMRSASITVLSVPKLTSGVGVTVSSGTKVRHEGLLYQITVPSGATGLTVTFTGGTGDGDIFVQKDVPPDDSGTETGCHSWNGGNAESCTVVSPAAGTWYIFVAVWDPYAGATLKATVTP